MATVATVAQVAEVAVNERWAVAEPGVDVGVGTEGFGKRGFRQALDLGKRGLESTAGGLSTR